jgi:hypothetical protein
VLLIARGACNPFRYTPAVFEFPKSGRFELKLVVLLVNQIAPPSPSLKLLGKTLLVKSVGTCGCPKYTVNVLGVALAPPASCTLSTNVPVPAAEGSEFKT